jgi:hypothetical protein
MKTHSSHGPWVLVAGSVMALSSAMVQAQSVPARKGIAQRIDALEQQVSAQGREIEAMRQQVLEQEARYQDLERSVAESARSAPQPVTAEAAPAGKVPADAGPRPVQVGVAPAVDNQPPPVAPLFDQPGILTQPGHYVLEPSLQYGYSSSNRVALVGYTIIPALLIGLIDVREVKRNTLTAALTGRWGLTRRLEVEMKVPYVYRSDDSVSREIFEGRASERAFNSSGRDIGDIEFAARYQLNEPKGNDPYLIGSLRFKTRTGKDPFEVITDCVTRCLGNTHRNWVAAGPAHGLGLLFAAAFADLAAAFRPRGVFWRHQLHAQFRPQRCEPPGAGGRAGVHRQRQAWRCLGHQLRHGPGDQRPLVVQRRH